MLTLCRLPLKLLVFISNIEKTQGRGVKIECTLILLLNTEASRFMRTVMNTKEKWSEIKDRVNLCSNDGEVSMHC